MWTKPHLESRRVKDVSNPTPPSASVAAECPGEIKFAFADCDSPKTQPNVSLISVCTLCEIPYIVLHISLFWDGHHVIFHTKSVGIQALTLQTVRRAYFNPYVRILFNGVRGNSNQVLDCNLSPIQTSARSNVSAHEYNYRRVGGILGLFKSRHLCLQCLPLHKQSPSLRLR
jgi:hypothetical protein